MPPSVCHFSHLELLGSAGTDIHAVTPQVRADLDNRSRRRRVVVQVLGGD
jgi:hypothetical protein